MDDKKEFNKTLVRLLNGRSLNGKVEWVCYCGLCLEGKESTLCCHYDYWCPKCDKHMMEKCPSLGSEDPGVTLWKSMC